MKRFWKHNGLSVVFALLFIVFFIAQTIAGYQVHNSQLLEDGAKEIGYLQYFNTGHFFQSTFENWESEFLQMGLYVVLSAFLFQKGSSESNDPDTPEPPQSIDQVRRGKNVPWPLTRGKIVRILYSYSLSIAFFLLFSISFVLHWYGSLRDNNEEQLLKGESTSTALQYLGNSRFWFESFQNWQSEFLAVLAVVVLSIFLRHKGSAQSKKITDPDSKTRD